ncbi:phage tail tube protein [Streptomyces inhibens]|uniref:phage tail tube protein n=1 Tax=Streptomyces inhibens TaxID=2293571 RepID=UPI00402AE130
MSLKTPSTQTRFLRRGISKIYWLKKINDPKRPTRKEISEPNRFDLTNAVSDIEGWALENDPIETPDMGSTFNSSIPGNDKAENSSLTFYEDRHSDAIEQQLPKGAKGYVVLLRKGDIPGSRSVDVFPVQVATRAATYSTGNEAAKFKVDFTITDEPSLDRPVPEAFHTLPVPDEDCDDEHDGERVDVTVVSATKTAATITEHGED